MTKEEQLQKIAENVPKVYGKGHIDGYGAGDIVGYKRGYTNGHSEGYEEGYDQGKAEGGASNERIPTLSKSIIDRTVEEITPSDIDAIGFKSVGWGGFLRCSKLKRFISTAEQNIQLGNFSFQHCSSLLEAHFCETSSCTSAFDNCSKLQKVVIYGNSSFGWGFFNNCTSLKVIDYRIATTVPPIQANATQFNNVPDGCLLVVPDNLYDKWSTATNWVSFSNIVITKASDYTEYEVVE